MNNMKIQQSGEDYLETIYLLQKRSGQVRSIDIANELGYSKASVSRAMKILRNNNYINMEKNNNIILTPKGLTKASEIYERHKIITQFFEETLGLDRKTSASDACKVEHVISQDTFEAIKNYLTKTNKEDK